MNELVMSLVGTPAEDPLGILLKSRLLLAVYWRYTRHALARNTVGAEVDPRSQDALSWCLVGAIQAVSQPDKSERYAALAMSPIRNAVPSLYGISMMYFSDTGGHAKVLDALDKGIAVAQRDARLRSRRETVSLRGF